MAEHSVFADSNSLNNHNSPAVDNNLNFNANSTSTTNNNVVDAQKMKDQAAGLAKSVASGASNAANSVANTQLAQDLANG